MSSFIFSSDTLARARAVPRRVAWQWIAGAIGAIALVFLSAVFLERTNRAIEPWNVGDAEIVFVGTSHTGNGVDPSRFDRPVGVVTFAGFDHQLEAATMARHQDRWPKLALAVIEVDEFTLLTDMTRTNQETPLQLLARLDLSLDDLPPAPDRGAMWKTRLLLSGNGTAALDPSLRLTTKRLFYDASGPTRERRDLTMSAGQLRVAYLTRIGVGRITDNIAALVKMSQALAARGVRVALISYPQHAYYRAARPGAWDTAIESALAAVRASIGDVPYWDFREDASFTDDDFVNVDHLSETGAFKLSTIVADRLTSKTAR